jgi:gluconolactonase
MRDRQGRLISCEHDSRSVTRTESNGAVTVLIDRYQGKRLNAPNDVVVHSNGGIGFTNPGYGILSDHEGHLDTFKLPANVYILDPDSRETTVVEADFARPSEKSPCAMPFATFWFTITKNATTRASATG